MRESCSHTSRITLLAFLFALLYPTTFLQAKEEDSVKKETVEPVFRVPKIGNNSDTTTPPPGRTSDNRSLPNYRPAPLPRATSSVDVAQRFAVSDAIPTAPQPIATAVQPPVASPVPPPVASPVQPPVARVASSETAPAPARDNIPSPITPKLDLSKNDASYHPLDRAIDLANIGLGQIRHNISDYTAILVKRERVDNRLSEPSYMRIKIRNPRNSASEKVPFSIYMKFIKPRATAGREVIWVDGQNNNNLIAHETGALLRFKNFHLQPDGMLAMRGNRYPIYDAGLEKLTLKLIEKAERDRKAGLCEVNYTEGAKINKRPCTVIEVIHNEKRAPYEFHLAKVYIDDELQIPIRFASYDWPINGSAPQLMEEYTYINVKLNVGLTDQDFSISNTAYNFAK